MFHTRAKTPIYRVLQEFTSGSKKGINLEYYLITQLTSFLFTLVLLGGPFFRHGRRDVRVWRPNLFFFSFLMLKVQKNYIKSENNDHKQKYRRTDQNIKIVRKQQKIENIANLKVFQQEAQNLLKIED